MNIDNKFKRINARTKKIRTSTSVIIAILMIIIVGAISSWAARMNAVSVIIGAASDTSVAAAIVSDPDNGITDSGESIYDSSTDGTDANASSVGSITDSLSFRQAIAVNSDENDVSVHLQTGSQSMFDTSDLPEFEADAYILIERRTGQTICEKNPDARLYPASITKIMTAILALENGDLNEMMTASVRAVRDIGPDGSNIGIIAGEKLRLDNLLDAMLVRSANETANIIAESLCETRDDFIQLMNEKAIELGAYNTNFSNASGIHETTHYSTAYDLALIANYAMDNERFREIVSQPSILLSATNKHSSWERLITTNALLTDENIKGYSVTGIKTGYHSAAGYCIVASGKDSNGMELLGVVLGVRGDTAGTSARRFKIAADLLQYGFDNFQMNTFIRANDLVGTISVLGGENVDTVDAVSDGTVRLFMPVDQSKWNISRIEYIKSEVIAPVESGETVGYVEYMNSGSFAGRVNLIATKDIPALKGGIREIPNRGDTGSAWSEISMAGNTRSNNLWANSEPPPFEGDAADADSSVANALIGNVDAASKSFMSEINLRDNIWVIVFCIIVFAMIISILRIINVLRRNRMRRDRAMYHGRLDYPPFRRKYKRNRKGYAFGRIKYDAPRSRNLRGKSEEQNRDNRDNRYGYSN